MKTQLLTYTWALEWKKIACCLNPVDKDVAKEWILPLWAQADMEIFSSHWVELISLDLRKWKEHITQILDNVDWVFVCWGDTNYLLQLTRENNFLQLLKKFLKQSDRFYCSTSAGSCRLWSHIRVYDEMEEVIDVIPWANLIPCMIIPHRSRDTAWSRKRYLWTSIEKVYNAECETLCITDNQAIVSDWKTFTIINH
jgi:peptidase E